VVIKALNGLLIFFLISACGEPTFILKPERVTIESADQIIPLTDSLVKPIIYQSIPSFENLTVDQSKEKFIAAVLPAILVAKHYLKRDRQAIWQLIKKEHWTEKDSSFYQRIVRRFEASNPQELIRRMRTHPNSIVIAQAAVESGWGSSRFFQTANNLFGVWSYDRSEPRVAADQASGVYLRKYEDVSESITDYFETLGRSRAYNKFRQARDTTNNVNILLPLLRNYSERKDEYIVQLATIIRQNDLMKYDSYRLDPSFFIEQ